MEEVLCLVAAPYLSASLYRWWGVPQVKPETRMWKSDDRHLNGRWWRNWGIMGWVRYNGSLVRNICWRRLPCTWRIFNHTLARNGEWVAQVIHFDKSLVLITDGHLKMRPLLYVAPPELPCGMHLDLSYTLHDPELIFFCVFLCVSLVLILFRVTASSLSVIYVSM